jgi:F-type H+-transporting ATPase subunit gamma
MKEVLENLAAMAAEVNHPLFEKRPVEKRALVLVTSDKGLAGAYNSNVIRRAEAYLRSPEGERTRIVTIGRKGGDYFRRRRVPVLRHYQELGDRVDFRAQAQPGNRASSLIARWTDPGARYLLHIGHVEGGAVRSFFPSAAGGPSPEHHLEPNAEAIFLPDPSYVTNRLVSALLEASASEHGARMIAMGSASRNARDMITDLTLVRNRVRQAAITKEISEIVGGAEALK